MGPGKAPLSWEPSFPSQATWSLVTPNARCSWGSSRPYLPLKSRRPTSTREPCRPRKSRGAPKALWALLPWLSILTWLTPVPQEPWDPSWALIPLGSWQSWHPIASGAYQARGTPGPWFPFGPRWALWPWYPC